MNQSSEPDSKYSEDSVMKKINAKVQTELSYQSFYDEQRQELPKMILVLDQVQLSDLESSNSANSHPPLYPSKQSQTQQQQLKKIYGSGDMMVQNQIIQEQYFFDKSKQQSIQSQLLVQDQSFFEDQSPKISYSKSKFKQKQLIKSEQGELKISMNQFTFSQIQENKHGSHYNSQTQIEFYNIFQTEKSRTNKKYIQEADYQSQTYEEESKYTQTRKQQKNFQIPAFTKNVLRDNDQQLTIKKTSTQIKTSKKEEKLWGCIYCQNNFQSREGYYISNSKGSDLVEQMMFVCQQCTRTHKDRIQQIRKIEKEKEIIQKKLEQMKCFPNKKLSSESKSNQATIGTQFLYEEYQEYNRARMSNGQNMSIQDRKKVTRKITNGKNMIKTEDSAYIFKTQKSKKQNIKQTESNQGGIFSFLEKFKQIFKQKSNPMINQNFNQQTKDLKLLPIDLSPRQKHQCEGCLEKQTESQYCFQCILERIKYNQRVEHLRLKKKIHQFCIL